MKKITLVIILFLSCYFFSFAQTGSVKGVITDTINKQNLTNTSVSLLRQKDSVLYKYTRSNAKGNFEFKNLLPGEYLLFVTHPTYADYMDKIHVSDTSPVDLNSVMLTLKANILKEVIVRQQISAIRMKGDTTEFAADSFKVREGASVEEMLKKLPGIQVDKDGKITAMGEKVEKVLVDGEEFFGDDPTIATKNLQADAIDKVQVFDKKSDQSTFTGIDDGERSKTINLKMKDDKKKGYFGKLDLGVGLNDNWANSAMINSFRAKRKLSAYGIMSSTGKTGLDWQENSQFGSDNGPEFDDDFGGFVFYGSQDELNSSSFYGEGLPKSWAAGINYSNKFNDDKQSLNGSYRYNKLNTEGSGSTLSQLITGDKIFTTNETGKTFSSRQRNSINGTYEWNIDSSTSIKLKTTGYIGQNNSVSTNSSQAISELGVITNNSLRNYSKTGDNKNLQTTLLLRKKFKKPGRTIALNVEHFYNENDNEGFLYALIDTLNGEGNLVSSITDQKKINNSNSNTLNSKFTYTEPLSKKVFVELNYALRNTNNNAELLSFNKDGSGKYEDLNDTFSNHYKFDVLTNSGGVSFKFNDKKVTFSAGSDIAIANFKQTDLFTNLKTERDFKNFFPRSSFTYKFNQSSRFSMSYRGNTKQPTINQIQPVSDNSNPLSITIGNPLLRQEFDHNINFNFNSFKVLSQRGFFTYGSVSLQQHAIVTNSFISDTSGKTIYQYINADGNYFYYAGGNYWLKLKKLNANLNFGLNLNGSQFASFVNNLKNTTTNLSPGINIGIGKDKEKKYNFYYNTNFSYDISTTTLINKVHTNYFTSQHNLNLTVQLPGKLEVNNEINATFRQKTELFDKNNNVFMWNGYIGRKLFKNDKGMIKIVAHDILNQNIGYSRQVTANQIIERNYQTLTRYFLLNFVWNFTKNPAGVGAAPNP